MKALKRVAVTLVPFSVLYLLLVTHAPNSDRVTAQQPAQQPKTAEQAFKNIKVLKNMPASQLQGAMSFMGASLGVDCTHCHTPPAMDKDDKPAKQTARRMLAMVNEINKSFGDKMVVNCATCHHGKTKPTGVPPLPSLNSPFVVNLTATKQTPLPTVEEILGRYVKALGGLQALDKITSRVRKGSVEVAGVKGTFQLYEAAPNKALLVGSLPPPLGSVQQAFDGTRGWVKNQSGVFDMSGEGLEQVKREWVFYADVKLEEQFTTMKVAGRERIDGRDLYIVQGTRPDGQIEYLYFDVESNLLVRRYYETPTYFGGIANLMDYDDYRKVGAVRLPFVIRRSRGGNVFLQSISEYRLNVKVEDEWFKKPAPAK